MTDKALAERLRKLAQAYRSVVVVDVTSINEATDLERAADLIEKMAQAEPVAWAATDESGTVVEALGMNQSRRFDTALYLAPPARRVPLSDEQIYQAMDAARESYRAHTTRIRGQMLTVYDDMDWHLARAIEQAVWEKNDD